MARHMNHCEYIHLAISVAYSLAHLPFRGNLNILLFRYSLTQLDTTGTEGAAKKGEQAFGTSISAVLYQKNGLLCFLSRLGFLRSYFCLSNLGHALAASLAHLSQIVAVVAAVAEGKPAVLA